MKTLQMITALVFVGMSSFAQSSMVILTFKGNTSQQVSIDGKTYNSDNYSGTNAAGNKTLTITDLPLGQHSLQVISSNNRKVGTSYGFALRSGYNMNITIAGNGRIQLQERRSRTTSTGQYKSPMSDANFNTLLSQVRAKRGQAAKYNLANSAVLNTANYFRSSQLRLLLSVVSGESYRLQLAKNAYRSVVDPNSYSQVAEMINSSAGRSELEAYIRTYNAANGIPSTGTQGNVAMSDANFTILYNGVKAKWLPGAKMSELTNIFNNTSYYFTTNQAKQLIQVVSDESNRLQLAKLSYRSITDPVNFSTIYDLLPGQSSRDELDLYVRTNTNNNNATGYVPATIEPARTTMADAEYNALMEDVRSKWLPGAKMSALTNIVNNITYHFSSVQARGLIQLVSDEMNRLQLAKSVYARLVDRSNYTVLYDLFSSQASRDELDAYARSYR